MQINLTKTTLLAAGLICSVAANFYTVTYILGHHTGQRAGINTLARKQIEFILSGLPRDKQADIRRKMAGDMEQLKKDYQDMRHDRGILADLLTAPTLDTAAINTRFSQLRDETGSSQQKLQQMTLNAFEQMTPEERQHTIDSLVKSEKK